METHHEQAHRRSAASRRDLQSLHGRSRPGGLTTVERPSRIDAERKGTNGILRKCSEHDRVPGVPPPRVRSRPACLPPSRPHCHLVDLDMTRTPSAATRTYSKAWIEFKGVD